MTYVRIMIKQLTRPDIQSMEIIKKYTDGEEK
jgi:hypothetical protein